MLICIGAALVCGGATHAAAPVPDFTDLSIEELDALSISAAAKRAQPLFETPAAVSVLLPVDIRRTGHASVAEALRLVPGVHVTNQLPSRWGIGVRGFNGLISSKLLVLVDGRSVYSPFYGSVEWPNADVHLDDLARVEVVRGPGATLWGANAVNGIINVISKDARDTQGASISVRSGTGEMGSAHVRYGGRAGDRTWYRVYIAGAGTSASLGSLADDPQAQYRQLRAGVRTDSQLSDRFDLTWQSELLRSSRSLGSGDNTHQLGSVLGRLTGRGVAGGDLQLQMYFDQTQDRAGEPDPSTPPSQQFPFGLNEDSTNLDLDLTHHFQAGERHEVTWGGGFRRTVNEIRPAVGLSIAEPRDQRWLFNAFVQDEVSLRDDLRLTLGTKIEHHETIGWQPQPNVRLAWIPNPAHTVWAAVARAVRAPSRAEREVLITFGTFEVPGSPLPVRPEVVGNPQFEEELNTAYEMGWRWRPTPRFQTDLAAYFFDYDQVRDLPETVTLEFAPMPTIVQRYTTGNAGEVSSYGAEASWQWRAHDGWELAGGLAYGAMREGDLSGIPFLAPDYALPAWQGHLRSWWQLPRDVELSIAGYGASRNPLAGLPAQIRLDGQLSWHPRPDLALTLGLQNATDPRHTDVNTGVLLAVVEQRRSVFLRVQWRY